MNRIKITWKQAQDLARKHGRTTLQQLLWISPDNFSGHLLLLETGAKLTVTNGNSTLKKKAAYWVTGYAQDGSGIAKLNLENTLEVAS